MAGSFLASGTGWKTLDLLSLAQMWVNGSTPNYGVILLSPPASGNNEKKYYSSEHTDATLRPRLDICYTVGGLASLGDLRLGRLQPQRHPGCHRAGHPGRDRGAAYTGTGVLTTTTTMPTATITSPTWRRVTTTSSSSPQQATAISPRNQGTDDSVDSDADPATGKTATTSLSQAKPT